MKVKILVLGVGNLILRDEGLGVHLAHSLLKEDLPDNVEIQEGGTQGLELLAYLDGVAKLIIVDCVTAGMEPGTIVRFEPGEVDVIPEEHKISFHDLGIYDFLRIASFMGILPPTVIFGMEPLKIDWGEELSSPVAAKMEALKGYVLEEIKADLQRLKSQFTSFAPDSII